ncbi:MAG: hypothetical protein NTY45_02845 [Elusimicrobia bacterium]|nr:hypothetical protein [Elusimicrobiota bacterium]
MDDLFNNAVFMRGALDAVPSILLVVDEDVRVFYRNNAARALLKGEKIYGGRAGEIMHCIHSEDVPAGCGRGPNCGDCVVRNAVNAAFAGKDVHRRRTDITVKAGEKTLRIPALVSASAFILEGKRYSLLVIEDISELIELRSLLPICAACKKIRNEDGEWESIEIYLKKHLPGTNLTHGLCQACARKLYPDHSD